MSPRRCKIASKTFRRFVRTVSGAALALLGAGFDAGVGIPQATVEAQVGRPFYSVEQRAIEVRDPSSLPRYKMPATPPPPTVSRPLDDAPPRNMTLDEALRVAFERSEVVRVLGGVGAATSGRTVYDVAASSTAIDQAVARFDPQLRLNNNWVRGERPVASFVDPLNDPTQVVISGFRSDAYQFDLGLAKPLTSGGTAAVDFTTGPNTTRPGLFPLGPEVRSSAALTFTQPLLQGAGREANLAPVVIARIDTERSYFQFKDSLQELGRGVIEAYWQLVAARTDVWARRQQVNQALEAMRLADARFRKEINNGAEVAQARLTLANFRATLVASEANLIQREAALRNILGLPPADNEVLVPVTQPSRERLEPDWEMLVELAEERRPDLIELKLVLEADEQAVVIANNQARPRLDAVAQYRWNGLEGEMPLTGVDYRSGAGQYTDWTLGVNFSVPIGLRQSRATLRRQELIVARDRANLQQGLHNAAHVLASNLRSLALSYEQFEAYQEARVAARFNLEQQMAQYRSERVIFLNVLQAITDWGNAVSAEAASLTQYNVQLANLERQTGTILETHGITLYEERWGSIGPLGRRGREAFYPAEMRPTNNEPRYPGGDTPAEQAFDLNSPPALRPKPAP